MKVTLRHLKQEGDIITVYYVANVAYLVTKMMKETNI